MNKLFETLDFIPSDSNASDDMQVIARNVYAVTSLIYNLKVKHANTAYGRPFSVLFTKSEELLGLAALYDGMLSDEFNLENELSEILNGEKNGDTEGGTETSNGVDPSGN